MNLFFKQANAAFIPCLLVFCMVGTPATQGDTEIYSDDVVANGVSLKALNTAFCDYLLSVSPTPPQLAACGFIVFVTSTNHVGDLGGLSGADSICNTRAAAGGLSGTFRAALSTYEVNLKDRIQAGISWIRPDGLPVAATTSALFDGTALQNPININEFVESSGGFPWTGSSTAGVESSWTCSAWTTTNPIEYGDIGDSSQTSLEWLQTSSLVEAACYVALPLYCFQSGY